MSMRIKNNYLVYNGKKYKCSIGRNGFSDEKKEGDGCTPIGVFQVTEILFRKDKLKHLITNYHLQVISPSDGWCDDPSSSYYNKKIKFPFSNSAEKLYRDDDRYDIVCVTNHNQSPIISGRGSAIFIHVASNDYSATAGCIALSLQDLTEILSTLTKTSDLHFGI